MSVQMAGPTTTQLDAALPVVFFFSTIKPARCICVLQRSVVGSVVAVRRGLYHAANNCPVQVQISRPAG